MPYKTTDHRHPMNQKKPTDLQSLVPAHAALPLNLIPAPPVAELPCCPVCKGVAHVKPWHYLGEYHCEARHRDWRNGTLRFKQQPPGHPYKWEIHVQFAGE